MRGALTTQCQRLHAQFNIYNPRQSWLTRGSMAQNASPRKLLACAAHHTHEMKGRDT